MTKCFSLAASVSNLLRRDSCISGLELRPVVVVGPATQKRDYWWRRIDGDTSWKRSFATHAKGHVKKGAFHLALPAAMDVSNIEQL